MCIKSSKFIHLTNITFHFPLAACFPVSPIKHGTQNCQKISCFCCSYSSTIVAELGDGICTSVEFLKDPLSHAGEETSENLKEINSLFEKLDERYNFFEIQDYNYPRLLIYWLIYRIQNDKEPKGEEVSPIKMDESEFEDAKHIAYFALNVYQASKTLFSESEYNIDHIQLARGMNNRLTLKKHFNLDRGSNLHVQNS